MSVPNLLRRAPPIIVLVPLLTVLAGVYSFLPLSTFVRALFLLGGFLSSVLVFYLTSDPNETDANTDDDSTATTTATTTETTREPWLYAKVVTILAALTVVAQVWFDARPVSTAVFVTIGFLVVAYQLRDGARQSVVLYEIALVYAVPLFTKLLAVGLYFGGGDVLSHIIFVEQLLSAGDLSAITSDYWKYPVYPLLTGSVRLLFGLGTYDAIVLTGLAVYTLVVPVLYLTTLALSGNRRVALGTAVGFAVLVNPKYYTLYFFPQALAVVMLFVGFYLQTRLFTLPSTADKRRYAALIVGLAAFMAMTHHLTFALAWLPIGLVLGFLFVRRVVENRGIRNALSAPSGPQEIYAFPVLITMVVLVAYWLYTPSIFLSRLVGGLVTFIVLTTGGSFTVVSYGLTPPENSIEMAVGWLFSADSLYYVALSGLTLVGFYEVVRNYDEYWSWLPVVGSGLVLGGLLLPLPLPIPWVNRIRLVAVVVAVFPLGVGIARTCRVSETHRRYALASLFLVAVVGTAGLFNPLLASNIDGINSDKRRAEFQFEKAEYQMLGTLSGFLDERAGTTVTATTKIAKGLSIKGYQNTELGLWPRRDGIRAPAGLLVVREKWVEHKQALVYGEFTVSKARFDSAMGARSKVYTDGAIHLLWSDERFVGLFGPNDAPGANGSEANGSGANSSETNATEISAS